MMSTLDIRDVRKSYGRTETLKGIDISLAHGEFLVLLGPSGCGKSTLLNIIAGLAEPTSGDVLIDGRSVVGVHPKNRDISMVFQSYALYPNLTVRRNIGFGLEMRKVPAAERDKAVRETATLLQIENLLDRKPAQLSGGQRQRVAIGRALVRKPRLFLFDEPLSNLDAKLRLETRTELKRLHQMLNTTIVYVTHDQVEAMTLATRIAVMRDGRIEQLGTPKEIYDRPATRYVAGFVGAPPMNMLDAVARDGRLVLADTDASLPLPAAFQASVGDGQAVTVGVRPEALHIAGSTSGSTLGTTAEVVELTGPEIVATLRLDGAAGQRIVVCLPPRTPIGEGDPCRLAVDPDTIHLFDPESGRSLERIEAGP
jgi:multiple sugar transport system ATP-binding protein